MIIQSGAKAGKSTQELFLKDPDWFYYFVSKNSASKLADEFRKHDKVLTAKPFVEKCFRCNERATRMTAYSGNAESVMFWCESCDPYTQGARRGMLTVIRTFKEAMRFAELTCNGRRVDKRLMVKHLAQAKGLPKRVSQAIAIQFLA